MTTAYTYLALGDSYTIGESVPLHDSFPCQVVQLLRNTGKKIHAPEIVARTGWTTAELASQLDHTLLDPPYDFVTLLIGVNNQYRGLPQSDYITEFSELLDRAISLTRMPERVLVLSIPDWSVTPFARERDGRKVHSEIALYNGLNREVTIKRGSGYIDITSDSPMADNATYLAADGLHPSRIEYTRWARMVAGAINEMV